MIDRIQFWNVTAQERATDHPADAQRPGGTHLVRAMDVDADPAIVFRWLCQVTVAPYSFDLVDNLGRRSPGTLTPGAEDLRLGQKFGIGPIVDFETGGHITAVTAGAARRMFGDLAMSYQVVTGAPHPLADPGLHRAAHAAGGRTAVAGPARRRRPRDDPSPAAPAPAVRRGHGRGLSRPAGRLPAMADFPAGRHPRVAVIGGSGFYEFLDDPTTVEVSTPYGAPVRPDRGR